MARLRKTVAVTAGTMITASICSVNGATLATRNVKDFDACDIGVLDPYAIGRVHGP